MWRGVRVIQKPTEKPISVALLKKRLRLDEDHEDDLIEGFLDSAIAKIDGPEGGIGYAMMEQTWRKAMDEFPSVILLPGAPIKSVSEIKYIDRSGDEQTMDAADYRVDLDTEPARVTPAFGKSWPTARDVTSAVMVEYVLGENDPSAVPSDLVNAIGLMMAHWFQHREEVVVGTIVAKIPNGAHSTLDEYRRIRVAS